MSSALLMGVPMATAAAELSPGAKKLISEEAAEFRPTLAQDGVRHLNLDSCISIP